MEQDRAARGGPALADQNQSTRPRRALWCHQGEAGEEGPKAHPRFSETQTVQARSAGRAAVVTSGSRDPSGANGVPWSKSIPLLSTIFRGDEEACHFAC